MTEENWVSIPNTFGMYQVSDLGRVLRTDSGTILKAYLTGKGAGYPTVNIGRKNRKVHRLVAESFVPNPYNLPQVNHIDGDKTNNNASNLEWVTNRENATHAVNLGLSASGSRSVFAKLTEQEVREIRSTYKPNTRGFGFKALAKRYGVSDTTIRYILNGRKWKHDGH